MPPRYSRLRCPTPTSIRCFRWPCCDQVPFPSSKPVSCCISCRGVLIDITNFGFCDKHGCPKRRDEILEVSWAIYNHVISSCRVVQAFSRDHITEDLLSPRIRFPSCKSSFEHIIDYSLHLVDSTGSHFRARSKLLDVAATNLVTHGGWEHLIDPFSLTLGGFPLFQDSPASETCTPSKSDRHSQDPAPLWGANAVFWLVGYFDCTAASACSMDTQCLFRYPVLLNVALSGAGGSFLITQPAYNRSGKRTVLG
jgi:hypothetical protein